MIKLTDSSRGVLAGPPDFSWLTVRWAARVLVIYATAAVAGASVFLVYASLSYLTAVRG